MASHVRSISTNRILQNSIELCEKKSNSWKDTIHNALFKNSLVGRVCKNWKASVLKVTLIIQVAAAVFCLFAGHFFLALPFLLGAATEALMHKEVRDFTRLYKAVGIIHRENGTFKISNFTLKKNIQNLAKHVETLNQGLEVQKSENIKFAENNQAYSDLINTLSQSSSTLAKDIKD